MREALKYINRSTLGRKEGLRGAEIGVRAGQNALSMLQSMNIEHLYLVDHWKEHKEASGNIISQEQQDSFYNATIVSITPYQSLVTILNKSSEDASKEVEDGSLDFVYIDGGHSYDAVKKDMKTWLPKLKKGGYLCGHDFGNPCTPDVARAVKDFSSENSLQVFKLDDIDWYTVKP